MGMSAEVIDARSLVPFNYEKVVASVKKTGKIIVAGDATSPRLVPERPGGNQSVRSASITWTRPLRCLGHATGSRRPHELEGAFFPQPGWFIDMIHERIQPLKGYMPGENFTDAENDQESKKRNLIMNLPKVNAHLHNPVLFQCFPRILTMRWPGPLLKRLKWLVSTIFILPKVTKSGWKVVPNVDFIRFSASSFSA